MGTPAYNQLNFMQRLAVRHAVFEQYKVADLAKEPGILEKALETIAVDPQLLKKAISDYDYSARNKSLRISLSR